MNKGFGRYTSSLVFVLLAFVALIFVADKLILTGPGGTPGIANRAAAPESGSSTTPFASRQLIGLIPFAIIAVLLVRIMIDGRRRAAPATVLRGIRGATTVTEDTADAILEATEELVREIVAANALVPEDIGSALFTVTPDLHAEFPAAAARRMGWTMVPLLNFTEIGVPGRLERCIRVLVHVNTTRTQNEMVHVYLREAVALRPDLAHTGAPSAQPTVRSSTPQ